MSPHGNLDIEKAVGVLKRDLELLFKLIVTHKRPVKEAEVRSASVILRRWLLDDLIGKLCREIEARPTFPTDDNQMMIDAVENEPSIRYFLTGGVVFNGTPISCIYESTLPAPSVPLIPVTKLHEKVINLGELLRQKRIYCSGNWYSCKQIITFVANKLGGVHFEVNPNEEYLKLQEAAEFASFGGPLNNIDDPFPGEIYLLVEPQGTEILSGFHVEIIAAAASFLNIHIDDKPLLDFKFRTTFTSKLRRLLSARLKRRFIMYDRKNES